MTDQPPSINFLNYLKALRDQGGQSNTKVEAWRLAVLHDVDVCHAASHGDEGMAKTALAAVTMRIWPNPGDIPPQVWKALAVASVSVGWSKPEPPPPPPGGEGQAG
jgi:hypothetical protein